MMTPLMLLIPLAILVDSPGRPLFRQQRIGLHGRPFTLLKFRTMAIGSGRCGELLTIHRDKRITRIGRSLRRWHLDELPQLLNILRGDMSFVGPRPEVGEYVAHWPHADRAIVLSVRPGL